MAHARSNRWRSTTRRNGAAAAPYVHAKISPENTKTNDNLHITLAQLVMGSYELEAAGKAKQIEGQVVKQVPAE